MCLFVALFHTFQFIHMCLLLLCHVVCPVSLSLSHCVCLRLSPSVCYCFFFYSTKLNSLVRPFSIEIRHFSIKKTFLHNVAVCTIIMNNSNIVIFVPWKNMRPLKWIGRRKKNIRSIWNYEQVRNDLDKNSISDNAVCWTNIGCAERKKNCNIQR